MPPLQRPTSLLAPSLALMITTAACAHRSDPMFHDDQVAAHEPMEAERYPDAELDEDGPLSRDKAVVVGVISVELEPAIAERCEGIDGNSAFFEFDESEVPQAYKSRLEAMATCMTEGPLRGEQFEVIGMADQTGPTEYNDELSRERANSVVALLAKHGVNEDRLQTIPMGEAMARPSDNDPAAKERRVLVRISESI